MTTSVPLSKSPATSRHSPEAVFTIWAKEPFGACAVGVGFGVGFGGFEVREGEGDLGVGVGVGVGEADGDVEGCTETVAVTVTAGGTAGGLTEAPAALWSGEPPDDSRKITSGASASPRAVE